MEKEWLELGQIENLKKNELQQIVVNSIKFAVSYKDGVFGVVSGVCNHAGGPLGKGTLDGEFIVCPWHYWKFHRVTGSGEPGYEADRVPKHEIRLEGGKLWATRQPEIKRERLPHTPHSVGRDVQREPGPIRVLGISTTVIDPEHPRYSTSEDLLQHTLTVAEKDLGLPTKLVRLSSLKFRNCEGFYSKNAHACTWPCSITQMDATDQLDQVYEGLVHWADIVLVATPIRWGAASSLYYKMAERLNCIQNQITTHDKILIRNKVAAFIITGGQDNIQSVAGQLMGFFSELGFVLPPFPYVAHSLGWNAENMERNVAYVQHSEALREGSAALLGRAQETVKSLLANNNLCPKTIPNRAGRKGFNSAADRI